MFLREIKNVIVTPLRSSVREQVKSCALRGLEAIRTAVTLPPGTRKGLGPIKEPRLSKKFTDAVFGVAPKPGTQQQEEK